MYVLYDYVCAHSRVILVFIIIALRVILVFIFLIALQLGK